MPQLQGEWLQSQLTIRSFEAVAYPATRVTQASKCLQEVKARLKVLFGMPDVLSSLSFSSSLFFQNDEFSAQQTNRTALHSSSFISLDHISLTSFRTMSAIFDFASLITVVLLLICTTAYLREMRPAMFDGGQVRSSQFVALSELKSRFCYVPY